MNWLLWGCANIGETRYMNALVGLGKLPGSTVVYLLPLSNWHLFRRPGESYPLK